MRRRELLSLLGGAAVSWPVWAGAQQAGMPVIGFLVGASPDSFVDRLRAFRQGLNETGYVEGENVRMVYRWADNHIDRLPELAAELVRRKVAVIVATGGPPSTFAAKAATTTIPIVFVLGEDPVRLGLVASLARPGGNLTGINFITNELTAKRLELLRELVPGAAHVAVLVNPANATSTETTLRDLEPAARAIGLQIQILHARYQPRDRCGFRNVCARAARRHLPQPRCIFQQPAGATCQLGGAACNPHDIWFA